MAKLAGVVALTLVLASCSMRVDKLSSRLAVHAGSPAMFREELCVAVMTVDDASDARRVRARIASRLAANGWQRCGAAYGRSVEIIYTAGPGVCIDCAQSEGYSGFAFITLTTNGQELVGAEWQGWGAASPMELADRFNADVRALAARE